MIHSISCLTQNVRNEHRTMKYSSLDHKKSQEEITKKNSLASENQMFSSLSVLNFQES